MGYKTAIACLCICILIQIASCQSGKASAVIQNWSEGAMQRYGVILLEETAGGAGGVHISGSLRGLPPGPHGFHVHDFGDLGSTIPPSPGSITRFGGSGCSSASGHFNPTGQTHGDRTATNRHAGDLGNILADAAGNVEIDVYDAGFSLFGANSVLGRALMVHAGEDDLGLGGDSGSRRTGNAGSRFACGIIGVASKNFQLTSPNNQAVSGVPPQSQPFPPNPTNMNSGSAVGVPVSRPTVAQNACVDVDTRTAVDPTTGLATNFCQAWSGRGWCRDPSYAAAMRRVCARTCGFCA